MPKKKSRKNSPELTAAVPAEAVFGFASYAATRLVYELLEAEPDEPGTPERPLRVNFNISYEVTAADRGQVKLSMQLLPDMRRKPYRVELEIAGIFVVRSGEAALLEQFCRTTAPTILFPYAREHVSRLTSDAPRGPIRLDPVNLMGAVQEGWNKPKADVPSQSASAAPAAKPEP